jgi:putative spermidine/putrescine transport system ATP-binding protein
MQVELVDLCKQFAGKTALENLRLSMRSGELVSLLGPSGCGKTTTLRIIAGFETPDSGAVLIGGQDIVATPPARRGMGVVFQHYALFPHLSAWNNIAFGMKIAGRSRADIARRVPELLELVGLGDSGSKHPHEMSGGQQQRIALVRALAIEPRMLLLDEPLSALDAVVRVALRDEIRRIQTSLGITALYVTHDQEEALAISDRVVVMRDGRIEQVGTAEDIYSRPASTFVAGFIGKMNQLRGRVVDSARGLVQCGSHLLRVPTEQTTKLTAGSDITVLVRPEAITVVSGPATLPDQASDNCNALVARVDLITFLGSVKRVGFDAAGHYVVADVPAGAAQVIRCGDSALLTFPVDVCRVLITDPSRHSADRVAAPITRTRES